MDEQQIRKYAVSISQQFAVDQDQTERLLRGLSHNAHGDDLIAYAVSLISLGVDVETLILAAAQLQMVATKVAAKDGPPESLTPEDGSG